MDPDTGTGDGTAPDDDSTGRSGPEATQSSGDAPAAEGDQETQAPVDDDGTDTTAGSDGGDDSDLIPAIVPPEESESGPTPAIVPLTDARGDWPSVSTGEESATREVERDLTPDEVTIERPDEFEFEYIPTEDLPTGVQYTPDFDPDWVYPSGSDDGGRQDDTPVQGLEIGVIGTADALEATVRSVLDAVSLYYDDTGQYPRHRIIKSASAFEEFATDGVGLVAVLQPAPDVHDGLMDHTQAVQANEDGAVDSNVETARRLIQYLGAQLVADGLDETGTESDVVAATGWETAAQIGTLPIAERYAPLGAAEVYDPDIDDLDLSEDGVDSVAEADFTPRRLAVETDAELFDSLDEAE
jgi:hypothetical protein